MADRLSFRSPSHEAGAGHRHSWGAANCNGSGLGVTLPFIKPAKSAPCYEGEARYCPMLAVDIKAFNDPERGEDVQRFLRAAMYDLLAGAFEGSCLQWAACHREDRGDGVLIVAPPGSPGTALIDPLVDHLRAGLRRHNKLCSDLAAIRLRMAVHAGQVQFDQNGVSGYAVTHLFRMLEAASFKRTFAASDADFALVASAALYEDVISQGPGLIDPDMYAPINIRCKETRARAWLYLPPVRNPFLRSVSTRRGPSSKRGDKGTGEPARPRLRPAPESGGPASAGTAVAPAPRPAAAPTPLRTAIAATLPRPRTPLAEDRSAKEKVPARAPVPEDPAAKESVPARARLIASRAVSRQGWLASVPGSASVQARFRGRLHPGQRFQHV